MKHKVSELEGPLLDAAVCKAEGIDVYFGTADLSSWPVSGRRELWRMKPGGCDVVPFSLGWQYGGPIIERERIALEFIDIDDGARWDASMVHKTGEYLYVMGPTPLIAAMRVYVMSRLGDEIDLPE